MISGDKYDCFSIISAPVTWLKWATGVWERINDKHLWFDVGGRKLIMSCNNLTAREKLSVNIFYHVLLIFSQKLKFWIPFLLIIWIIGINSKLAMLSPPQKRIHIDSYSFQNVYKKIRKRKLISIIATIVLYIKIIKENILYIKVDLVNFLLIFVICYLLSFSF